MYEGGEDLISTLPDGVVGDILSRLPTKDAVRTSILSKDWEYKWTVITNIQLDDRDTSLRGNKRFTTFVSFVERVLHLTRNSRIKSFRLSCSTKLDSRYMKTCIAGILMRGVQNLEIKTYQCKFDPFKKDLYNYRSLTELKLVMMYCNVSISLMKNCFPNLKILHFGNGVHLWGDKVFNTSQVILFDFPVLEDLELRCCAWRVVKSVEINAPKLIRFVAEGKAQRVTNDYLIKIDAPKLEKFESHGLLDNFVVAAPSISNAVLTNCGGDTTLGFRAHALLKGFLFLKCLKLSSEIVHAFIESNLDFFLPCFNRLKQLEFKSCLYGDDVSLWKLLQVMRSLESLSIEMYVDGLKFFPTGMASRLKVVELVGFRGTESHNVFAKSVLGNAHNLETLFVFVGDNSSMKRKEIKRLLSTSHKSSPCATVVVNGPRKRKEN